MTFSEQFKDIFDMLCEKIGVAIDWTQDNIVPYVMEIYKRYVTLNIIEEAIWTLMGLIGLIVSIVVARSILKEYTAKEKDKNKLWNSYCCGYEPTGLGWFYIAIAAFSFVIGIVCFPCGLSDLLKWILVPEIQIVKDITNLLSAA